MEKHNASLKISIICVKVFTLAMIVIALFAPKIFSRLIEIRIAYLGGKLHCFLRSTYILCLPRAVVLAGLYKLLTNIQIGDVFTDENTCILGRISICCFVAAAICLASRLYYLPFLILFFAAGFVGLILQVVKNVFRQAVAIKADNDFTI